MITIAAEHFQLTPAIRTHVEGNLSRLRDILPKDATIHVFLSEPARHDFHKIFMVLCKIRIFGKDIIVREENENLYTAIETVRTNLIRKIVDIKHKWVRIRRKDAHLERLPVTDETHAI